MVCMCQGRTVSSSSANRYLDGVHHELATRCSTPRQQLENYMVVTQNPDWGIVLRVGWGGVGGGNFCSSGQKGQRAKKERSTEEYR